jgi:hypothetical protein
MRGELGKEAGVFHGQGGHRDTLKEELAQYFRLIDESLRPVLRQYPWPLILAGVEYELAIYREVSGYARIAAEVLRGGFDYVQDHVLYEQALPLAERARDALRRQALAKYSELGDTSQASDDVKKIVPAAHAGRIDTLLVDPRAAVFGRYHPEADWIGFTDERDPALDLVELAAAQTILHGGTVYAVTRGELPSTSPLQAIFRY